MIRPSGLSGVLLVHIPTKCPPIPVKPTTIPMAGGQYQTATLALQSNRSGRLVTSNAYVVSDRSTHPVAMWATRSVAKGYPRPA